MNRDVSVVKETAKDFRLATLRVRNWRRAFLLTRTTGGCMSRVFFRRTTLKDNEHALWPRRYIQLKVVKSRRF